MRYEINYLANAKISSPAFSYDPVAKSLTSLNSRVSFEEGFGEFSIVVNGDYPFVFDSEGLLVGDVQTARQSDLYPRLDIIQISCPQIRQRIASITQDGLLTVAGIQESDVLPTDSLNLLDMVAFDDSGITTTNISEVWYLADNGNYVCTEGQLIRVRL